MRKLGIASMSAGWFLGSTLQVLAQDPPTAAATPETRQQAVPDAGGTPLAQLFSRLAASWRSEGSGPTVTIGLASGREIKGQVQAYLDDAQAAAIVIVPSEAPQSFRWVALSSIETVGSDDPSFLQSYGGGGADRADQGFSRTEFRQHVRDAERRLASTLDSDVSITVDFDSLPDDPVALRTLSGEIDQIVQALLDRQQVKSASVMSLVAIVIKMGALSASRDGDGTLAVSLPAQGTIDHGRLDAVLDRALPQR